MHQPHGAAATRVLGAFARIVRSQALLKIVGDAAIQGVVGAADKVADPGQYEFSKRSLTPALSRWERVPKAGEGLAAASMPPPASTAANQSPPHCPKVHRACRRYNPAPNR